MSYLDEVLKYNKQATDDFMVMYKQAVKDFQDTYEQYMKSMNESLTEFIAASQMKQDGSQKPPSISSDQSTSQP